jgi:hypothetical protein
MAESQLSELRNMRVLLEVVRGLSWNLAYHRRARLEAVIGDALDELDRQIEELRSDEARGKPTRAMTGVVLSEKGQRYLAPETRSPSDVLFSRYTVSANAPLSTGLLGSRLPPAAGGLDGSHWFTRRPGGRRPKKRSFGKPNSPAAYVPPWVLKFTKGALEPPGYYPTRGRLLLGEHAW